MYRLPVWSRRCAEFALVRGARRLG